MIKNFVAKLLRTPKFKQRKVESKKKYKEEESIRILFDYDGKERYFMTITSEKQLTSLDYLMGRVFIMQKTRKKRNIKDLGIELKLTKD